MILRAAVAVLLLSLPSFAVVVAAAAETVAQETEETNTPDWIASIGASVWFSQGDTKWEHRFPIVPGFTGGSRLHFTDVTSIIASVDADLVLWRRFVLTATGGWGPTDGGELIDEDFINGVNFSRTRSSIEDGHVYFANLNAGIRLAEYWAHPEKRHGFIDLLVGYQWWQEKYVAFGVAGALPASTKVITETWTWHGVRVGGRAYFPFPHGFGVRGNAFVFPWSSVDIDDTHHLRADELRQNPSFALNATGGFGFQLEGAITYTFWRGLGVEAGYRYWQVKINGGDFTSRPVGAPELEASLKNVSTQRGGPFVGLYYRF